MNNVNKQSLVLFSGGIDSTAILLWMLDNTDDEIEVHHIILKNKQNRYELEIQACDKIIEWMKKNKRPFKYTESIIDLGLEGGVLDMYVYMWLAGLKSMERRGTLDRVVTGRLKPFNDKILQRRKNRTERVEEMFRLLVTHSFDEEEKIPVTRNHKSAPKISGVTRMEGINQTIYPELFKPLLKMTKEEVISLLPEELLEMCFYCRYPKVVLENGEIWSLVELDGESFSIFDGHINKIKIERIENCNDCHSCLAVRRSLGEMTEQELDRKTHRMMD